MSCIKCFSDKLLFLNAKCSDNCYYSLNNVRYRGHAPKECNIGGDDYITFLLCLNCGFMHGKWPAKLSTDDKTVKTTIPL